LAISPISFCTTAWRTTARAPWQFIEDLKVRPILFCGRTPRSKQFAGRKLQPWDISYYAEKQRRALYEFDEEQLRPYFPAERVVDGMFAIVERLYGVQVKRREDVPCGIPDVRYYEVRDRDGAAAGRVLCRLVSARDQARRRVDGGLHHGRGRPGAFEPHLGCVCGNLTPPIGDKPALLTHREVETIFHEFGHLLHHVLSRVEVKSLAGTAVAWDFVELPSQIMENWCWERGSARLMFARHYETGEAIPEDLFQKLVRARTYRGANMQMRQLGFGFVDLKLHRDYDPARDGDVMQYTRAILQQFTPAPLPGGLRDDRGFHASVRKSGGLWRGLLLLQMGRGAGCRCVHALPRRRHLQSGSGRAFREISSRRATAKTPPSCIGASWDATRIPMRCWLALGPDLNGLYPEVLRCS
jgi:hypothetical protein